jgi:hypothetical protein
MTYSRIICAAALLLMALLHPTFSRPAAPQSMVVTAQHEASDVGVAILKRAQVFENRWMP